MEDHNNTTPQSEPEGNGTTPADNGANAKPAGDDAGQKTVPLQALHEARAKAKEAEARVAEYEAKEKQLAEEKMKEEGRLNELLSEKEKQLEELKPFREKYEALEKSAEDNFLKELEVVPKEKHDFIKKITEGKNAFDKTNILKEAITSLGLNQKKTINKAPADSNTPMSGLQQAELTKQIETAKQKGDVMLVAKLSRQLNAKK